MSRTDHHRRNRGRFTPSRYQKDGGTRVLGEWHWRDVREATREEREPVRKQITAQVEALIDEGAPIPTRRDMTSTPECADSFEDYIEPVYVPSEHRGAQSTPEHMRECADCTYQFAVQQDEASYGVPDESWSDPESLRQYEAQIQDLMGANEFSLPQRRRALRWDATKYERTPVWQVARDLGLSARAAVHLLRVGLNEYVTGASAHIPVPVVRELTALVTQRPDETEALLVDVPNAHQVSRGSSWAALLERERQIAELRTRLYRPTPRPVHPPRPVR